MSITQEHQTPDESLGEGATFCRASSLRRIIRTQFALRGIQPTQKDADLSSKFSEETMKVLEAGGASDATLRRQVQLFASATLMELEVGKMPKPEQLGSFLLNTMGLSGARALTREDWDCQEKDERVDRRSQMVRGTWRTHCDDVPRAIVPL